MQDPFAVIEQEAQREGLEKKCLERLGKARRQMIFAPNADWCFWATLALRVKMEIDWNLPTGATDGTSIYTNPGFLDTLPDPEVLGYIVHEVAHLAMKHHARRHGRDPQKWNIACDAVINPRLKEAGIQLPDGALFPGKGMLADIPGDLSEEATYARLPDRPDSDKDEGTHPGKGKGKGKGDDPGGCGGVMDPGDGSESACEESAARWQVAIAQAAQVARARGAVSAGLGRWVQEVLKPITAPWEVIRNFLDKVVKSDSTWAQPDRRFVHQGLYLPGPRNEVTGDIAVLVDCSGSIDDQTLILFAAGIHGIVECYPGIRLKIAYHDSAIRAVQTWEPADGPLVLTAKGGGGTSHVCCWKWIEALEEAPACAVCLTDMMTEFGQEPDLPVLWAATHCHEPAAPFGVVANLDHAR